MSESPSGSRHRYFNQPKGVVIKNSTSSIGPGIDVRGEGGMVIAPPSVRGDGAYRWLNDNPIADLPQWLIDLAVGKSADDADLGLARKNAGGNGGEDPNRFQVAEGFRHLDPDDGIGEGIKGNHRWDRLPDEHKDEALEHGLEQIASNSKLLELADYGGNNDQWFRLVTSIARSGAPHAEDIFVKYASKATNAVPPDALRQKFRNCQKNP